MTADAREVAVVLSDICKEQYRPFLKLHSPSKEVANALQLADLNATCKGGMLFLEQRDCMRSARTSSSVHDAEEDEEGMIKDEAGHADGTSI